MSEAVMEIEGAACQPNISPAGVRLRRRIGMGSGAAAVALAGALVATHARWFWSLAELAPAGLAAVSLLQARRKTCVSRAAEGTFEHDDFSKTPAGDDDARRSRVVAAGITRDAILIAVGATMLTVLATRL